MKNIQKKKGFTIVELVIVIAVIAILSSIMVPTFANLITKANISKDTQLVKNLNMSLATYDIENKKTNAPLSDILDALEENGMSKDSIKSSSGSIIYDSNTNRFILLDKKEEIVFYDKAKDVPNLSVDTYKYWKIYDNNKVKLETTLKYSIYWNSNEEFPLDTISVGIDLGSNTISKNLTFVNDDLYAKSVIIKTNGGSLTINGYTDGSGNGDTIYHYKNDDELEIIKVGNEQEHEHIYGDYVCDSEAHTKTCTICGNSIVVNHKIATIDAVVPTCTTSGLSEGKYCEICDYVIQEQVTLEPSHSFSDEFTIDLDSACNSIGVKSKHCTLCDAKTEQTYIEPTEHSFSTNVCDYCGKSEPKESNIHKHDWRYLEENSETNTRICYCSCIGFAEQGTVAGFSKLLESINDDNLTIKLDKDYNFVGESHNFNLSNNIFTDSITPKTIIIDGDGYTIYNLNSVSVSENAGLFGEVSVNLKIINLNINGGEVESTGSGGIGCFVGFNNGANIELENCSASNVKVNMKDTPEGSAGGLVGKNSGVLTITSCKVDNITLKGNNCGGILGKCEENSTTSIIECSINNIDIQSVTKNSGGVIGYAKNCVVTINTIIGNNNKIKGTTKKGVIIGNKDYTAISCESFNNGQLIDDTGK